VKLDGSDRKFAALLVGFGHRHDAAELVHGIDGAESANDGTVLYWPRRLIF
jgi:hypothetical protein